MERHWSKVGPRPGRLRLVPGKSQLGLAATIASLGSPARGRQALGRHALEFRAEQVWVGSSCPMRGETREQVSVTAVPGGVREDPRWDTAWRRAPSGWLTLVPHMVQRAWVGDIRAARMAGTSPAMAPMTRVEASPPAQARGGMTVAQCLVWA
jgi:hypothetical protein